MNGIKSISEIIQSIRFELESDTDTLYKSDKAEAEDIAMNNFKNCGASSIQCDKAGFEKFVNVGDNYRQRELFNTSLKFVQDVIQDKPQVLILHGNPGTGKTYFALSILKHFCSCEIPMKKFKKLVRDTDKCDTPTCLNDNHACCHKLGCEHFHYEDEESGIREFKEGLYIKSDDLCEKVLGRQKYLNPAIAKKIYSNTELLVIDEIGRPTGFNAKAESEVLFKILDERKENGYSTVMCSNLNEGELQQLMGKALWSRLSENGIFFDTSGIEDMRSPLNKAYVKRLQDERRRI